jgi:5-(carboxyamino)imidazole ribonucleotide synthase
MARLPELYGAGDVSVHLYGKASARAGRKMGHANRIFPLDSVAKTAEDALLSGL